MQKTKLPEFLEPVLWSYDLTKLDKDRDQRLIISQGLNYGNENMIQWVMRNYNKDQIRQVITHPRRGMWLRKRLRRWLGYFGIMIDPLEFEAAIRDLNLRPKLTQAFFARKGL